MAKKKSFKIEGKHIVGLVALLLVAVLVIVWAIGSNGFKENNPAKWFGGWGQAKPAENELIAVSSDGEAMYAGGTYEMPEGIVYLATPKEYAPSGEIAVTASLSNEYINAEYDWSVSAPAGSTLNANDYITVTPDANGSATAKIKFIRKSNKQLTVKATLRGSDASATCTVDFVYSYLFEEEPYFGEADIDYDIEFTVKMNKTCQGTIALNPEITTLKFELIPEFQDAVRHYVTFDVDFKSYEHEERSYLEYIDEEDSEGYQTAFYSASFVVSYSMFIDGWSDYDEAQQQAIQYAWWTAYKEINEANVNYVNVNAYVYATTYYDGHVVDRSECLDLPYRITGENYGTRVKPSVTLNQNVVF